MILSNFNPTSPATILLTLILKVYFRHFYCVLQFSDDSKVRMASQNGNYLLSGNTTLGASDANKYDLCLGIVIKFGADPQAVFEMFEEFIQKHSRARFQERRYVILFGSTQQNQFENFFKSVPLRFVSDILVLQEIPNGNGSYKLFTHQYVGVKDNEKMVFLDEWNFQTQTFKYNAFLYPEKLDNLQGKKLVVGGQKYLPITDPVNLKGPETRILMEYAERHNASLVFDTSYDYLGVAEANWTGTGYMGKLLTDKIDLIAFAVYTDYDRLFFGDFAQPLCEIRVTCLVPKPEALNIWMIIKIFQTDVWLLMGVNMFIVLLVLKLFKKYHCSAQANTLQYLTIYRICIAQPEVQVKTGRFLISVLLAANIIIQTFFNSKLYSYIAVPSYIDDINTLQDLAASDLYWYSKFNDKGRITSQEKHEPFTTIYKKFRFLEDEITNIKEKRYAYAIDESFASGFYSIEDDFTLAALEKFKVMTEFIIGHQYTTYLLRRNSVWLIGIDKMCYKAMEYGLIKYWEKDSVINPSERRIQEYLGLSRRKFKPTRTLQLEIKEIMSYFIIWISGLGVSFIIFILEYIIKI